MIDKLSTQEKLSAVSLSTILALGIGACSSEANSPESESTSTPALEFEQVGEYRYYEDGTRSTGENYGYGISTLVHNYCDGPDFIDRLSFSENLIVRSVGHPACADGKITPEDFEVSTTE